MRKLKVDPFFEAQREMEEQRKTRSLKISASPFLVSFYNLFFYFGVVPFLVKLDTEDDKYKLKTNSVQQVLCGLVHIAGLIFTNFICFEGIRKIKSEDSSSIVAIFDFGSNFGHLLSSTFLMYVVWMRRDSYLQVIEKTRRTFPTRKEFHYTQLLVYIGLLTLLLFFAILDWFLMKEKSDLGGLKHISFENFENRQHYKLRQNNNNSYDDDEINSSIDDSFKQFGDFDDTNLIKNDSDATGILAIMSPFLVIVQYFIVLYLSIFYMICQTIFILLGLSLRQIGNELRKNIEEDCYGEDGIEQGIVKYRKLKCTTDLIRNVYGDALLGYYISSVAYYAQVPYILLGRRGEAEKMVVVYFIISGLIWIIAAEFHNNVRTCLLKWIEFHEDRKSISYDNRLRLHTIYVEVSAHDTNAIALSNKCFAVTYTHLGSMLGLVVTYGIIVFQLRHGEGTK